MLFYFYLYKWIIVLVFITALVSIAFFTLAERKVIAAVQRRRGPNVVGFWGLLQPVADGVKLLFKEVVMPARSNRVLYVFAPYFMLFLAFVNWATIPVDIFREMNLINSHVGLLYTLAVSSLSVYGIIISGWASNSKYAFIGSLRSAAQMVSYEIAIGLVYISLALSVGSFDLIDFVVAQENLWFAVPYFPLATIFFVSMLAETNRAPFDLPEAEAEIVAGYNIEYSSFNFAAFFLAEYGNMLMASTLMTLLFFGGWLMPFNILSPGLWMSLKVCFFAFMIIFVRANFPRFRYDQLMDIGWSFMLPFLLVFWLSLQDIIFTVFGIWGKLSFNFEFSDILVLTKEVLSPAVKNSLL
jgi:NADH-quinone oxidoreductase subunit H